MMSEVVAEVTLTNKGVILHEAPETQLGFEDIIFCCCYVNKQNKNLYLEMPPTDFAERGKLKVYKQENSYWWKWDLEPNNGGPIYEGCFPKLTLIDALAHFLFNYVQWTGDKISQSSRETLINEGFLDKDEDGRMEIYRKIMNK